MPGGNGNKFKGNSSKKARRMARMFPEFDESLDLYAQVVKLQGGANLTVLPLEAKQGDDAHCYMPGKFRKKAWLKPGDVIIIRSAGTDVSGKTKYEMQGKPPDNKVNELLSKFEKAMGEDYNPFATQYDSDEEDDELSNYNTNIKTKSSKLSKNNKIIPEQPSRDLNLDNISDDDEQELNIDDI